MTALPAVSHVAKVALSGTIDGEPWAGVSHWQYDTASGPLTNANANKICTWFTNRWGANIAPRTATQVILSRVDLTDLTSSTAAIGEDTTGSVGALGDTLATPAACVLEHKTIGRRYRGGHPRTYWPGVASLATLGSNGRTLTATEVTNWEDAINAYYAGITTDVVADSATNCLFFAEVCVHYFANGGSKLKPPVYLDPPTVDGITARGIEPNIATQRRRLRRSS